MALIFNSRSLVISIAVILLTACTPAVWDGNNQFHPTPTIATEVHYIQFIDEDTQLVPWQQATLTQHLTNYSHIQDIFLIPCDHTGIQQQTRLNNIVEYLLAAGYNPKIIPNNDISAEQTLNCVQVAVRYLTATSPNCSNTAANPSSYDHVSDNFGCITGSYLAVMLDNPNDLRAGRGVTDLSARRAVLAIQKYYSGVQDDLAEDLDTISTITN